MGARAAALARFLPPQYLVTFVSPMWLCGAGPSGDILHTSSPTRIPEAEHHPENVVLVLEKGSV